MSLSLYEYGVFVIYLSVVSLPSLLLRIGIIIIMSAAAAITAVPFSLKGSLLSIVFVLGTEMHLINKKNNHRYVISPSVSTSSH
jgi:hypothetical protein